MIAAALHAGEQPQNDEREDREHANRNRSRGPDLDLGAVMRRRREARTRLVDRKVALVNRDDRVPLRESGVALLVGTGALLDSFLPRRQRAVTLAIRRVTIGHGAVTLAVGLPAVGEGLVTLGAGAVATLDRLVAGCDRLVTRDVGHLALALDRRAQL